MCSLYTEVDVVTAVNLLFYLCVARRVAQRIAQRVVRPVAQCVTQRVSRRVTRRVTWRVFQPVAQCVTRCVARRGAPHIARCIAWRVDISLTEENVSSVASYASNTGWSHHPIITFEPVALFAYVGSIVIHAFRAFVVVNYCSSFVVDRLCVVVIALNLDVCI